MKILKDGKKKKERIYEPTCRECRCVFSFKSGERNVYEQMELDNLIVRCPSCGEKVFVNKKAWK